MEWNIIDDDANIDTTDCKHWVHIANIENNRFILSTLRFEHIIRQWKQ